MSTVFASLVRPPKLRRASTNTQPAIQPPPSIDSHGLDEPDLRDLNAALQALTDIFPDIQPEVFREMLSTFSEESRLQVVTETLLKHGDKYVRGRYRMPAEQEEQRETAQKYKYRKEDAPKDTRGIPLAVEDKFRSRRYKDAAKEALYQEFKGLSHSTIKAVLAEYNYSYTHARPTLLELSTRSWRSSITNFLMRRKAPTANDHPLVIWTPADERLNRPPMPLLVKTRSDELNQELYNALIVPEHEKHRKAQLRQDFDLAMQWNEEEAEREGEMYDCECCFIPNTLQQMSTCDIDGHYICFRCIRHAINAALYDQGWARNINTDLCTLKCIAPMTGGSEECHGCIPLSFVRRALLEEQDGKDNLTKLNERFASDALTRSQLPLVQCPFCSYAELDDLALPDTNLFASLRFKARPLLTSLRLTLERATTDAVKRTCPQCNLGFVKSEGCNKLVCLCGYSMCYICRQGLANEGYQHFCGHFRERPGQPCGECNKCDLYRVEDEERVVKRAKDRAEAEWWEAQGEGAKEGLQKEVDKNEGHVVKGVAGLKRGSWEGWIEGLLDSVLV
ncbi:unnamed protein product [Alternaria alternata]